MNETVDPELKAIHQAALGIYNRETETVRGQPTSVTSVNATNFLAGQASSFADAALFLLEDARQPVNVPAALLRTCLEAQAKANHIISVSGAEREQRAREFEQLMHVSHSYYEKLTIQLAKDFTPDESKILARERPYFRAMKAFLGGTDTSNLAATKRQFEELNRRWTYGNVVERSKFLDPKSLSRSEAQPLQPALHILYVQCCAFVHADASSLKHQGTLTRIGLTHNIVLVEVIAVFCFLVALGKGSDGDLDELKGRIIAFDVNERILPKKDLPPV